MSVEPDTGVASWRALGTYVHLRVHDRDRLTDAAQLAAEVLDEVDRTCSRFRADSDLSRANARPGTRVPVSPVLVGAVRVAIEAAVETDGLVDPTLGLALAAAGYDRTFELVAPEDASPSALPLHRPSWRSVLVDDETLLVPPGTALDLGATGKAYAADLVALTIAERLGTPLLVSVGGDVRAVGDPDGPGAPTGATPGAGGWPVVLAHTESDLEQGRVLGEVRLGEGGLATSTVSARRWVRGGRQLHHLLDPRTGAPTGGRWSTATAYAPACVTANVATTAALVRGDGALAWLEERGIAALLVDRQGTVVRTAAWVVGVTEVGEEGAR